MAGRRECRTFLRRGSTAFISVTSASPVHKVCESYSDDHAMWFHRPFRADEWFLYDQESPIATGGRGLARGRIYDRSGQLLVSVVQEGLFRRLEP
ncbi:acyl-CoA thioesterase [Streptomyces griseus]|uniref:acyl-CoA thioesterase n=1 Tax=Streptomyces griseus TaxID=1911 RepID=UPI00386AE468